MKLKDEDMEKLLKLYETAQNTPVIKLSSSMDDWASIAWRDVKEYMDKLGKEYGFDPRTMKGICAETGEIILCP